MEKGYFLFFVITGTGLFLILSAAVILLGLLLQRKKFLHLQETLRIREAFEKERLLAGLEARDRTIQEMGEVIHDSINQNLALVTIQLQGLKGANEAEAMKLREQKETLARVISALRDLSHLLNPAQVEAEGLRASLEMECQRLSATGKISASISGYLPAWVNQSGRAIILYRMCQEMMQNAIKHSEATELQIVLEEKHGEFSLQFSDNGIGFDPAKVKAGNGLSSLRSRARVMGAEFIIRSSPGKGAAFVIQFNNSMSTPDL